MKARSTKRLMMRRIISMILVFCMVFTSLPLSAFAAEADANRAMSEQVALYMLELGLVDEQGNLIYDNTFTVEDSTKLANLDELLDWLLECPDDELDTLITVDATGKAATAEWIITAINIETQMELLTGGLNNLASGAAKSARTESGTSVVTAKNLQAHKVYLVSKVVSDESSDTMKIQVGVSDTKDGDFTTNHEKITIDAGIFCDFLVQKGYTSYTVGTTVNAGDEQQVELIGNSYRTFTLPDGQSYVELQIDLAAMRNAIKNGATDIAYKLYSAGQWGGAVPLLFQCRIDTGAHQQSTQIQFSFAVDEERSDAVTLLENSQSTIIFEAVKNGSKSFFSQSSPTEVTSALDNKTYYKISIDELYMADEYNGITAKSMSDALTDIYDVTGVLPEVVIEGAALMGVADSGPGKVSNATIDNNAQLYYMVDGAANMIPLTAEYGIPSDGTVTPTSVAKKVAAVCNGSQTYKESNTAMKNMYNAIYDTSGKANRSYAYYRNLHLPTKLVNGKVQPVTTLYIAKDWIKSGSNSADKKPEYFCLWGNMYVEDTEAPAVAQNADGNCYWVEDVSGITWHPGDVIPIGAVFTEPITLDVDVYYETNDGESKLGSVKAIDNTVYGSVAVGGNYNSRDISRHRMFYYTVQPGDEGVSLLGVKSGNAGDDVAGNPLETTTGLDYLRFDSSLKLGGVLETAYTDAITGMTAVQDKDDPQVLHVTVNLNSTFKQLFTDYKDGELNAVLDYNRSTELANVTKYPLKKSVTADGQNFELTCDISLDDADKGKIRTVEIAYDEIIYGSGLWDPDTTVTLLYYGAYAQFTQEALKAADENSYTISAVATAEHANGWPSGAAGVVYASDTAAPMFSYAANDGATYTYKGKDTLTWQTDAPDVIGLVESNNGATCTVVAKKAGTANIYLQSDNAGKLAASAASAKIKVTVKDGAAPGLMIPSNASTMVVRSGEALQVAFYSNLSKYDAYDENDIKITANLYVGSAASGEPCWSVELDRGATTVDIPANKLNNISVGGAPAYVLRLSANAKNDDGSRRDLATEAKIVVNSQPAVLTMSGLEETMFAYTKTKTISWTIANFDSVNENDRAFEFVIEKNGAEFYRYSGEISTGGSYKFTPDKPSKLKDTYVVMMKAKNGTDPSWSIASGTLTVYDSSALKLMVGGNPISGALTLQTEVRESETTTAPTVTPYGGTATDGLTDANAIARLRTELTLMDTVSVNYQAYDNWSLLYDTFSWKAENVATGQSKDAADEVQKVVSINYRQSNYWQPIENFSYAYYLPETVFMLCGLQDGTAKVTAEHKSVSELSAELTVNVNRLKDKLYLFQFTPAVETTLSYTDGEGKAQSLKSNADGSLALWEPNGIDGELRLSSVYNGEEYRSTVDVRSLRSGEGNGIERELYPLNAIELTRGAVAEFTLLKPDGSPLANTAVTLRGGVYRNPDLATNRDDAYCADAKFALNFGDPADIKGTEDINYTTDANGKVTLRMDSSQFKSKVENSAAAISDNFRFIFELQVAGYNPEILICDSGQTYKDLIRTGNNLLTLTAAETAKPLVVVQTVDYYTGRDIDVRDNTGVVGPSPDYPAVELQTQLMLWGVEGVTTNDTGYRLAVRTQESAAELSGQTALTAREVSYPFSSIPLVENVTVIDENTFKQMDGSKRIPLELALYDGKGALSRTVLLPFGLVDVTAIPKLSTDTSLIELMANLTVFGTPTYEVANDGSKSTKHDGKAGDTLNGAAAELIDSMGELEKFGAKMGLVRTILMPTADPTIFSAYIWTGYDTTEMADLRYDEHGIYTEPTHFLQSEDQMCGTFFGKYTISDFRAMSDGTYHEKWQEDNSDIASLIFGDGSVMKGWMTTEIVYNFDKGKWQIVATGGGFTWGKQIELGGRPKQRFKPFPYNYKISVRGGMVVSLDMAVRYAEQLGEKWDDETARAVNDYLTSIRINAYLEAYAGLGIDYGIVLTVGVFGSVELNNENRILNRNYLDDKSKRKLTGSFVQLDGEIGVRESFGIGPATVEWTLFSYKLGNQWRFKNWTAIDEYWENATSGFSTGLVSPDSGQAQSLQADYGGQTAIAVGSSGIRMQSRDYLSSAKREWLGGSSVAVMSLDAQNRLEQVQTNAYPYSRPLVSDDGSILVYLSDNDSTDVQDVEVRFSLMGTDEGKVYGAGSRIADPTAVDSDEKFSGYGDSALDFDGDGEHAGAVWLREDWTLDLKPGAELDASQQLALVNGLEVVASIWDGNEKKWTTTRLTDNGTQEMSPIIAVNDDGNAIVAWREVQANWETGTEGVLESMDFSNSRILYRLYQNGTWGDTHTLYNGTSGAVKGMSIEMIGDTALVAMALDDSSYGVDEADKSASEIYYAVVDTAANDVEAATRIIRATTNDYLDENPQLAAIDGNNEQYFVLGWHSLQTESNVEQNDVGLRVLDKNGTPLALLPETLSNMVSTEAFGGQFTFVKGATALNELSLLWNDVKAGGDNNDVIRAIKFGKFGEAYAASAPIEVAELNPDNSLNHMDAYATGDNSVYAMLQVTEYDYENQQTTTIYVENEEGGKTALEATVPGEETLLCSATGTYQDSVAVIASNVDYDTLSTNAQVPVTFTVKNQGLHAITDLTLTVADASTAGAKQTLSNLNLLPGKSQVVSPVITTGDKIADMAYTVTAKFATESGAVTKTDSGTLYLDYPDVGISGLQVISEEGGKRAFIATMYNQAAATLATDDNSRRVVLGVYTDPACTTGVDGKYFGGTSGKAYEIEITGDDLRLIDADNFAKKLEFDIAQYIADYNAQNSSAELNEIPEQGVMLFVQARVEQKIGDNWMELPEADTMNNLKNVTFTSLLSRSNNEPTTMSVELTNNGGKSQADVQVRNNSLQARSNGHLLATLVDARGNVLETQNVANINLTAEQTMSKTVEFSQTGAKVLLSYGEPVATAGASVQNITVAGLPLTIDSFVLNDEDGKYYATVTDVPSGTYVLTVKPESSAAEVTVNGSAAANGIAEITPGSTWEIVVTNGNDTKTYVIELQKRKSSGGGGSASKVETPTTEVPDVGADLPFDDVNSADWFYDSVRYVWENGLMNGTTENGFEPNSDITRGMIVTILHRLAGKPETEAANPFRDVADDAYFAEAIVWAAEQGVVTGYDTTTFAPNDPITREQLAAILWRYAKISGVDVSVGEDTNILSYDDAMAVSEYAVAAMQWACGAGIINGVTESTLEPQGRATRAQAAAILHRFCEQVAK